MRMKVFLKIKVQLILATLLIISFSLHPQIHKQSHKVSDECCQRKKGKLCGSQFKDCCRSECQNGIFGSKWCRDGDEYQPYCQTCSDRCKKLGGMICQISMKKKTFTCCKEEDCILPDDQSAFTNFKDKISDKAIDLIGLKHEVVGLDVGELGDTLLSSVVQGKCKKGTQIKVGQCVQNTLADNIVSLLAG